LYIRKALPKLNLLRKCMRRLKHKYNNKLRNMSSTTIREREKLVEEGDLVWLHLKG